MTENNRHAAKLTELSVLLIRARRAEGWTEARLGHEFGVSQGTIHAIVTGATWAHMPAAPKNDWDRIWEEIEDKRRWYPPTPPPEPKPRQESELARCRRLYKEVKTWIQNNH